MQTVENLEDTLAEGGASYDGVVDDDEVIHIRLEGAVGDIVHMGGKVVALIAIADEGAQFDVLPHHLFNSYIVSEAAHTVGHAIESHLGGVRDIREHRVGHIVIDGLHNGGGELFAQAFTLQIDIAIGATTEVDTLERAGRQLLGGENLL